MSHKRICYFLQLLHQDYPLQIFLRKLIRLLQQLFQIDSRFFSFLHLLKSYFHLSLVRYLKTLFSFYPMPRTLCYHWTLETSTLHSKEQCNLTKVTLLCFHLNYILCLVFLQLQTEHLIVRLPYLISTFHLYPINLKDFEDYTDLSNQIEHLNLIEDYPCISEC